MRSPFWEDEDFFPANASSGLDVYETDSDVVVKAAVPGIRPEEVDITFEDGVLRIQAEHKEHEEEKKKVVYQADRASHFSYTTTLPRAIDAGNIKAEVEDGVVVVTAPLAPEAKPRKITVATKK